jgi:outer membrane immunogenic protein
MGAALLIAASATQPTLAADVEPVATAGPWTAPPAYSARRVYNWTGVYVGLTAGGAWGRGDWTSVPDATAGSITLSGGLFGGTLGYNLQTDGSFVAGVEADISGNGAKGTIPAATCALNCQVTNPVLATARVRFGYAFNDILPYVTAGLAIGHFSTSIAGQPFGTENANTLSLAAGFGVEFVVFGPLTAKVEYLYADLSGLTCNFACNGPVSIRPHENIIRAGVNYRIWNQ